MGVLQLRLDTALPPFDSIDMTNSGMEKIAHNLLLRTMRPSCLRGLPLTANHTPTTEQRMLLAGMLAGDRLQHIKAVLRCRLSNLPPDTQQTIRYEAAP